MFTQRLSMDCTKEQYEKYLKEELLKMGYCEAQLFNGKFFEGILTGWNGANYLIQSYCKGGQENGGRTYLGKFNAPLFLALAAMTNNEMGNYGELWRPISQNYYKINDWWKQNNERGANDAWRKATASEIMAKFGEQQPSIEERLEKVERFIAELPCEKVGEPKYKEPIVGEMAIFWDNDKCNAACKILDDDSGAFFIDNSETYWINAILFESPKQYKEFINA